MGRSSRLRAKARRCTGALPSVRRPRRLTARDLPLTAGSSPPRDWKKTSSRCPRTSGWSPGMCRATSSTRASPRTMPSRFSATGQATTVSAPVACTAQSRCVALSVQCASTISPPISSARRSDRRSSSQRAGTARTRFSRIVHMSHTHWSGMRAGRVRQATRSGSLCLSSKVRGGLR